MSYCSTLGMLEIGVVVSSILFGILTMQIYFYHKNFSEDPPWIKLGLVSGIWFIELTHTVCIAHEVYFYSVLHFGDTSTFNGWPVSFAIAAICHGVVAVLAELVSNIVIGVEIATIARQSFISFRQKWQWLILAVLILRAALDVLISGTLVYYLTYHRNNAYKKNWYCYEPQYTIIPENLCQEVLLPRELHILSQNAPPVFSNTLLAKEWIKNHECTWEAMLSENTFIQRSQGTNGYCVRNTGYFSIMRLEEIG
ncbi:hypothetical protein C8J55DRAFT_488345 [Lentinula edodes]|uniref:Uncharacterized protein n=1 Tax=Lentinula lateritia TaxID=40482 RepID=A0A9W9AH50_9AGAR|nr:hypothetical protein C8J55DRAFT_488345 [Lentinula edodes]